MDELHSILQMHRSKQRERDPLSLDIDGIGGRRKDWASSSIPDVFFDQILVHMKLSRIEILVFIYIYRKVWIKPNLYKAHGISPIMSYTEMAHHLNVQLDQIYQALKALENLELIETIRAGQYFVRRFFTKEYDELAQQTYDDFDI